MLKKFRKLLLYIVFLIIFVGCFKVVFNSRVIESSSNKTEELPALYKEFNYGDYTTIRLLHTEDGSVEEIPLDIYLYGVVSGEMPADFEIEALKAQAIVARTYTIFKIMSGSKHAEQNADVCDSSLCCQAWITKENRMARWEESKRESNWEKIENAVNSTIGKVILYENTPINAFFHSNSGGKTELPVNVWGGSYPYLQSVETSGEDAYSSYNSELVVSKDDLIQKMLDKYKDFVIDFGEENVIQILEYTEGGRVKKIKIGNKEISGTDVRQIFGLRSAKFDVTLDGDLIKFSCVGYGHGVGMSQCGADSLAKSGYSCEDIIKHYYKDVEISE